jgi:hypothetical protein
MTWGFFVSFVASANKLADERLEGIVGRRRKDDD